MYAALLQKLNKIDLALAAINYTVEEVVIYKGGEKNKETLFALAEFGTLLEQLGAYKRSLKFY